jgi:hypothetical protein
MIQIIAYGRGEARSKLTMALLNKLVYNLYGNYMELSYVSVERNFSENYIYCVPLLPVLIPVLVQYSLDL